MTDREQIVDELFGLAVNLSPAEREKFLAARAEADGANRDVLDEVNALLTNYRQVEAKQFLDKPLISETSQTLRAGQDFEGYKILRLIAEGGMGEVYLAEDNELKRQVAIKLIKGHATKDILRHFHSERQILARLKHPNIAQLYEAGASSDGLPFFVMEYVEGKPIDRFADEYDLSVANRLNLFRTVCSAISYAHQNLVIHRDIKPGNILVTESGEPKLLDFGIAKLLRNEGEQDATATVFGAMTPPYASPEQVKGEPITTASDEYSLGVLLYELLTGRRPYKLKRSSAAEITKAICEQQPTKPSSIRRDAEMARDGDPEKRHVSSTPHFPVSPSALKGDLDNIILKALRKEPERRYASVEQFSEDIRRHLEGLPVTAHKGSLTYRGGKFIKRNKLAVAAAAVIVLTLAAGIIATTVEARRANRRFNQARQLAHTILFDYHDQIAALPGSTKVRERMVKDALQYLDNLSKDAGNDTSLLRELAAGYERVAAVQGGVAMSGHGTILSPANFGDMTGALQSLNKALAIREQLARSRPGDKDIQQELAYCYAAIGFIYLLNGPPDKAVEYMGKGLPIMEASLASDPNDADLQYKLWNMYLGMAKSLGNPAVPNLGDTTGAMEYMKKAAAVGERLRSTYPDNREYLRMQGATFNAFGQMFNGAGMQHEALDSFTKAAAIDRELLQADASNINYQRELAVQLGNVGTSMLQAHEDHTAAVQTLKEALSIYESMLAADPDDAANQRNTAVGHRNLATGMETADAAAARANYDKALEMFSKLVAKDPNNADFRRQWAYTYFTLSRFQVKTNDLNGAVESAQRGIKIDESLVESSPTNASARNTLALLYRQLGDSGVALAEAGSKPQWSAAKDAYQRSLNIYQDMKSKGTLTAADAGKPDELAKEIARCDKALEKF